MFGRLCRGVLTHTLTGTCPSSFFNCESLTTRNIFSGDVEGELCEETGVDIVGALDIIGEVKFFLRRDVSHKLDLVKAVDIIGEVKFFFV